MEKKNSGNLFLFSQINILLGGIIKLNKKTESKKPVEEN